jgi:hypothetical protein
VLSGSNTTAEEAVGIVRTVHDTDKHAARSRTMSGASDQPNTLSKRYDVIHVHLALAHVFVCVHSERSSSECARAEPDTAYM